MRPADRPLTYTFEPYWDHPGRSSHVMSLPHSCSAAVDGSQGERGTGEAQEGISGADCCHHGSGEPMQNQPEGSESRRGEALDLGAVPRARERPGRQKGGFGDAGHSVPLSPEDGKGLRQRASALPLAQTSLRGDGGHLTEGSYRDSSQHVRTGTDCFSLPADAPAGARVRAVGSLSVDPASAAADCAAPDLGQLFWFLWGYF